MAIFQPTNYARPKSSQDDLVFRPKRSGDSQTKRSGFLPRNEAELIVSLQKQQSASRAKRRNSVVGPSNTAPVTSRRQGAAAYRRSDEQDRTSSTSQNRGATFQRTFSGALQQSANSGVNRNAGSAQSVINRSSQSTTKQSPITQALQQYSSLNSGIRNTTDLLNRGHDTYRKTSKLNPSGLSSLQNSTTSLTTISIPPTLNSIRAQGINQYSLFNKPDTNSVNSIDLYLKAGPKRIAEASLFV